MPFALLTTLSVMIVPTAMAAFAADLDGLIFWRFVQGLVLPPVFAVTVAYIGEEWPRAQAIGVTGIYLSATGLGGFFGRFVTGLVAQMLPGREASDAANNLIAQTHIVESAHTLMAGKWWAAAVGVLSLLWAAVGLFVGASDPMNAAWDVRETRGFVKLRLVALGVFIGSGLLFLLSLVPSLPVIVVALAVCATCGFLCQTMSTSFVAVSADAGHSSAVGLYVTFYYIGGTFGGLLPAPAWEAAGWPGCVAIVIAALILMAALVMFGWRGKQ